MRYRARIKYFYRTIEFEFNSNNMSTALMTAEEKAKEIFIGAGIEISNWERYSEIKLKEWY